MRTKDTPWKRVEMVAGLLVKNFEKKKPSLLLGLRLDGVVADLVVSPGGHIEENDMGPITACSREVKEETGLEPHNGRRVAELHVRIQKPRLKIRVHIILFTKWSGRLKNRTSEFGWLKFIKFSEIPWNKIAPGDKGWMEDVLTKRKRRLVHISCGKNRKDVLSVRVRPLC